MIAWTQPSNTRAELEDAVFQPALGGRLKSDQGFWITNYRLVELVEELLPDFGVVVERTHYHLGRVENTLVMAEWVVNIPGAPVIRNMEYCIVAMHCNARATGLESRLYLGAKHTRIGVGFVSARVDLLKRRQPINLEWKVNLLIGLQKLLKKIGSVPLLLKRLSEVEITDGQASQTILALAQGAICVQHTKLAMATYFQSVYPETAGSTLLELYWACALAVARVPCEQQFYRLVAIRQRLLPYFDGEVDRL